MGELQSINTHPVLCPFFVSSRNPAGGFAAPGPSNATLSASRRVKLQPKQVFSSKQFCTEGQSCDAPEPFEGLQSCSMHCSLHPSQEWKGEGASSSSCSPPASPQQGFPTCNGDQKAKPQLNAFQAPLLSFTGERVGA